MRALVTGATGFLGRRLVERLLDEGYDVRALARENSRTDLLPKRAWIVTGDMRDASSLRSAATGCDVVFHAAATTRGSWSNWAEYERSTVRGTMRLLEAALASRVQRFVHVSSLAVYQVCGHLRNAIIDETAPLEPAPEQVGPYCRAKVESEEIAWSFVQRGLDIAIIRPGLIYGPERSPIFPHLGKPIGSRVLLMIGTGRNLLPLTHIDNVVDALLLAAERDEAAGEAFNIVDGFGITQREYLRRMMRMTGRRWIIVPVPMPLIFGAATAGEGLAMLGLTSPKGPSRYGTASKFASLRYSSRKARDVLGWEPRVPLHEGLNEVFLAHRAGRTTQAPLPDPEPTFPLSVTARTPRS